MKLLFLVLLCSVLRAEIREAAHFYEIAHYAKEDTMLVLDIDDTLLIPQQMLGSDEWFQTRVKINRPDGFEKSIAEWEGVRHFSLMKLVEVDTAEVIRQLQSECHCIMGLTTQGLALATRTVQQLEDHHIDLSLTAPSEKDHFSNVRGHGILFRKGILFTSGTHKGEALFKFCEMSGYWPKRIVFINDKGSHLVEIETEAKKRNIEFVGLRYAFADIHKAAFRREIADYQFAHSSFAHILTDEEADRAVRAQ